MTASYVHAVLEFESGPPITFAFNPTEYSISRTNSYESKKSPGGALPTPNYGGGDPQELTFDMFLDDLGKDDGSVDKALNRLHKAMEVDPKFAKPGKKNSGRPPKATFTWGSAIRFKGFIKSLTISHARFSAAGATTRATVKIAMVQSDPRPENASGGGAPTKGQNPTTRALPDLGTHVVTDGDTLQAIATQVYGDPNRWRTLASANGIDDPTRLRRGTPLALPRIEA